MLTFLGIVALAFAVLMPFIRPLVGQNSPLKFWTTKRLLSIGVLGVLLILAAQSFFIARESKQYYILNKASGERSAVMTPGLHFITPFVTEVREWDKYLEIKGVKVDKDGNLEVSEKESEALQNVEGVIRGGVSVRFIDKVTANVYPSVRFQLPSDPQSFIKLVETYRTPENLVMNTLVPTVSEQLKNITFMFTADEYVSGGATIYRSEIEDVLKNGAYIFAKETVRDTVYAEPAISGESTTNVKNVKREIREIKVFEKNKKMLKDGVAIRKKHEITENNIVTAQVIIDEIILDKGYEDKLKEQMNLAAQAVVENQKIIAAKAKQQSIIAEGERDKASERVTQEKEQVSKLISIETQVKEEESKRQLAEINVKTEELKAKATKISADAEAYKNSRLVQAGLTPLEKARIEKETKVEVARELAKMNVPQTIITGGSNSNPTESLLQTKLIKDIVGGKN
jgi:hypothetical protein